MTNICWGHALCHSLRQEPEVHGYLRLSSIPPEAHNLVDIFHEQSDLLTIPNYSVCVHVHWLMFRAITLRRINMGNTCAYLYFLYLYRLIPFHFYIVTYALYGAHKIWENKSVSGKKWNRKTLEEGSLDSPLKRHAWLN